MEKLQFLFQKFFSLLERLILCWFVSFLFFPNNYSLIFVEIIFQFEIYYVVGLYWDLLCIVLQFVILLLQCYIKIHSKCIGTVFSGQGIYAWFSSWSGNCISFFHLKVSEKHQYFLVMSRKKIFSSAVGSDVVDSMTLVLKYFEVVKYLVSHYSCALI